MKSIRLLAARIRVAKGQDERGASLVEYALLLALIAVVCIGAITFLGTAASSNYSKYGTCTSAAGTGSVPTVCH